MLLFEAPGSSSDSAISAYFFKFVLERLPAIRIEALRAVPRTARRLGGIPCLCYRATDQRLSSLDSGRFLYRLEQLVMADLVSKMTPQHHDGIELGL
jgi:hypothetical protein